MTQTAPPTPRHVGQAIDIHMKMLAHLPDISLVMIAGCIAREESRLKVPFELSDDFTNECMDHSPLWIAAHQRIQDGQPNRVNEAQRGVK